MQNFKKIILGFLVVSILIVAVFFIRYNNISAQAQDVENLQGFVESTTGLGDLNGDGNVNAVDASRILIVSGEIGANTFEGEEDLKEKADVDKNGYVHSFDAYIVLIYAANRGAGNLKNVTFEEYVTNKMYDEN